jgi:uncharacterized protein
MSTTATTSKPSAKREFRSTEGLEFRAAPEGSASIGTITGYAAKFDSNSVEFPGYKRNWVERIRFGAFKRSLTDQPDVLMLWNHGNDMPIARTPGTLRLSEDAVGLRFEADLPDTTAARDVLANIKAGVVRAMSFGFEVVGEEWVKGDTLDTRTLTDVTLYEVSPVVWPAYPETNVALRNAPQDGTPSEPPATQPSGETDLTELQAYEDRLRVLTH